MNHTPHNQAMHYVHQQVLERLLAHMNQAQRASVQLLMQRLLVIAGGPEHIGNFRTLVLHGADRRSAQLLAYLRAAQLSLAVRHHDSFHLRVLVARSPGLDSATLAAHDQCFGALFLHDDPRVELLRADAGQIGPYSARPVACSEQRDAARNAWLLFGHLGGGRPEVLLGARAYLELATVLDQALTAGAGVDALLTVTPPRQRLRLMAWGRRCLRAVTQSAPTALPHGVGVLAEGLMQLHHVLALALHKPAPMAQRAAGNELQVVALEAVLHNLDEGGLLERMLGREDGFPCEVHGPAGLFDPLPLAHARGLYAQYIEQRNYRDGSQAAFQRIVERPLPWPQGQELQQQAQERLLDSYGASQDQLVCQAFAPFAEQGRRLEQFVQRYHPRMRIALPYLHRALQGRPCPAPVVRWLMDISGLDLAQMRALYAGALRPQLGQLVQLLGRRDVALRLLPQAGPALPAWARLAGRSGRWGG
ncbi:hypothetical protein [Pseudomonas sp. NPDC089406]|uniref:hypothetical protein n=1 Tax=Pseudomonas sp. NPDC089406 TaxID=3364463 RepID=UPI00384FBF8C